MEKHEISHAERMAKFDILQIEESSLLRFLNREITSNQIDKFTNGMVRTFEDAKRRLHELDPLRY